MPADVADAITPFLGTIREQTLATSLRLASATGTHVQSAAIDDLAIKIGITTA